MTNPTVDLLIKDLDEHALMDIMDVIHQYELKYSVDRRQETCCDNDIRFHCIMKRIVENNTELTESMQPLIEEFTEHILSYELDVSLIEKCDAMNYIK
jgi:hypothetical protein